FGGLRHARRPESEFRAWLQELIAVAQARPQGVVDIFVADEITSGTGVNRIMNIVEEEAGQAGAGLPTPLELRFTFFVASTPARSFDAAAFSRSLTNKNRRRYTDGNLTVSNSFRWFHGPLIAYDNEDI